MSVVSSSFKRSNISSYAYLRQQGANGRLVHRIVHLLGGGSAINAILVRSWLGAGVEELRKQRHSSSARQGVWQGRFEGSNRYSRESQDGQLFIWQAALQVVYVGHAIWCTDGFVDICQNYLPPLSPEPG